MEEKKKRNKTQILREIQDTVDEFLAKKEMVNSLLSEIDALEKRYNLLKKEAKGN